MRRVVLDSNVWLSALLFPAGVCADLLQQLREHRALLVTSEAILHEVDGVLRRKFDYSAEESAAVTGEIKLMSELIEPTIRLNAIKQDEADNRVLECAIAGQANLIISGDTRHLLPLGAFRGIPIQSPRAVLDRFN